MQPFVSAVYSLLKTYFKSEVIIFLKTHQGALLLSSAFRNSTVDVNTLHGLKRRGIWPVDAHALGDEDYKPAAMIADTFNISQINLSAFTNSRIYFTAFR